MRVHTWIWYAIVTLNCMDIGKKWKCLENDFILCSFVMSYDVMWCHVMSWYVMLIRTHNYVLGILKLRRREYAQIWLYHSDVKLHGHWERVKMLGIWCHVMSCDVMYVMLIRTHVIMFLIGILLAFLDSQSLPHTWPPTTWCPERRWKAIGPFLWRHVMSCDVLWCLVMSCDVMWCHVMSCDVMWCLVMSCDVFWC